MFIGRTSELKKLHELFSKKTASLVVCKGRRRIGKSSLIQEFGKAATHFYEFQGLAPRDGDSNQTQLNNFSQQLAPQLQLPGLILNDWTEAFTLLANHTKKGKTVVFLDEISWLAAKDPDFAGKLKIAWDTKFKMNSQLILVLCGSVSAWINRNILGNSDFVGRISLTITLEELPLSDCQKFWDKNNKFVSSFEKLKLLSVTGGVPRYLEEIQPKISAEQNIHNMCFSKEGLLFSEFDKIFNEIFLRRAISYKKIVKILAKGNFTFKEICNQLGVEQNGVVSESLDDLVESGFLSRDYHWHFTGKQSKLSRYRIKDNYLRFYLKYIEPHQARIVQGLFAAKSLENLSSWETVMGFQLQNLVLNHLPQTYQLLNIDANSIVSAAPYFQNKNSRTKAACQIDLLIHTKFHTLYVCEIKFQKKIDASVIRQVQNAIKALKRPKHLSIRPVLIYEGELAPAVTEQDFFAQIVSLQDYFDI